MPFGKKAPPPRDPNKVRLFNIDFHLAVISDVKDVMKRVFGEKVEITDWSLNPVCGTRLGFPPSTRALGRGDQIGFVTTENFMWHVGVIKTAINSIRFTTYDFDDAEVDAFAFIHSVEMREYDGFVVTHSPVLCRLFERFNKPIVLVNSCRYDQPYCHNHNQHGREELNACLRRLNEKGLLIAISNNKADQEYLKRGAGIDSLHVPSLCLYTGVEYNVERAAASAAHFDPSEHKFGNSRCLIEANGRVPGGMSSGLNRAIESCDFTSSDAALLQNKLRTWEDIFQRQAIIHFPYEVSTMSIFEQYSAGVPLLVPSKRLMRELVTSKNVANVSSYWESGDYVIKKPPGSPAIIEKEQHKPAFQRWLEAVQHVENENGYFVEKRQVPSELAATSEVDFWLDRADFYDQEWMPAVSTFDSFEELAFKLDSPLQTPEQRAEFLQHQKMRVEKVLTVWKTAMVEKFPKLASVP